MTTNIHTISEGEADSGSNDDEDETPLTAQEKEDMANLNFVNVKQEALHLMKGITGEDKFGTVGCVVRDLYGNLAAAGSTGGLCNKMSGRVGDTPIFGSGIYANSATCAIACTGHGESFIKNSVAYDIHARMQYLKSPLQVAMSETIMHTLPPETGGAVGVDCDGAAFAVYNTQGMFTGIADNTGRFEVWHKEDLRVSDNEEAEVFKTFVDPFDSRGTLKILFTQKVGKTSQVLLRTGLNRQVGSQEILTHEGEKRSLSLKSLCRSPAPHVFFKGYQHEEVEAHPLLTDKLHTLILVGKAINPTGTIITMDDGTAPVSRLHWCIANIRNNDIHSGEIWKDYDVQNLEKKSKYFSSQGKEHVFVFLLYSHKEPLQKADEFGISTRRRGETNASETETDNEDVRNVTWGDNTTDNSANEKYFDPREFSMRHRMKPCMGSFFFTE